MQDPNSDAPYEYYSACPHPTRHEIKPCYVSESKILLRRYIETYRDLLSKYFKNVVLGHVGAVQISFLTTNRNMFTGKFVKLERFLAVLREHIIFNVK